jgi:hypothetical protein
MAVSFLLIIAIGCGSSYAINSFCSSMLDSLDETRNSILDNDWETAQKQAESIKNSLSSSRTWITILINQRMLNDIEIIVERLYVSVEFEDQLMSMAELVSLKSYLEEVRSDTFITITNLL